MNNRMDVVEQLPAEQRMRVVELLLDDPEAFQLFLDTFPKKVELLRDGLGDAGRLAAVHESMLRAVVDRLRAEDRRSELGS